MLTPAAILYLSSLRRARPRPIDRHIDYFGEAPRGRWDGLPPLPRQSRRRPRRAEAAR